MGLDLEQGSGGGVGIPPRAVGRSRPIGRDLRQAAVVVEGVMPGDGAAFGIGAATV